MFCPQCSHQQVSDDVRFCSRCGLSLGLVTDLLANSSTQLKREKREIIGMGLMLATLLMLVNFIIVFGAVTLPHLNPVFLWIWVSFVASSLIIGGFGLVNLVRGGYFKRLKERELQLNLMKRDQKRQMIAEQAKTASLDVPAIPPVVDPGSVTETTTRELPVKRESGAINSGE